MIFKMWGMKVFRRVPLNKNNFVRKMSTSATAKPANLVIGAGGYGLYLNYLLSQLPEGSTTVVRNNSFGIYEKDPNCKVTGVVNTTYQLKCTTLEKYKGSFDTTVFVTTKIDGLPELLESLKPKITPSTAIVLCHNGIGVYDIAKKVLPESRLFRMGCWFGVNRTSPNHIHLAGVDKFIMGGQPNEQQFMEQWKERLTKLFVNTNIRFDYLENPHLVEWRKTLWNITFNGLLSVCNDKNEAAVIHPEIRRNADMIMEEAVMVAKAEGITITQKEIDDVFRSIQITAANTNSTLQDLRAGLSTEIDFFNGTVVNLAKKHGLKAPANEMILNFLKYLEKTKQRKTAGN